MWTNLSVGVASTFAAAGLGWCLRLLWDKLREPFRQRRDKITYYRVIRWTDRAKSPPIYTRRHHSKSIAAQEGDFDVYDEVFAINGSLSKNDEIHSDIKLSSRDGYVDALQVLPFSSTDPDNHPITRADPSTFVAEHTTPSSRLLSVGSLFNGLQGSENWWFGTTAQKDGQTLLLIVDFSSLRNARGINFAARVERRGACVEKVDLDSKLIEQAISADVFVAQLEKAREKDSLIIDFEIV